MKNCRHIFAMIAGALLWAAPAFAAAPSGYYSRCENKGGRNLLIALHETIGSHTTVSYDGLWNVYPKSDVKPNGKIWDMYSTKEWPTNSQRCGNYKNVGDCYNREHSFPKSWFGNKSPMSSDAYHIYPTDGKVNGQRSNHPYGECANGTSVASNNGVKALGRLGSSTFAGYTGTVFEPVDEYKGDFARSYFYMAACYYDKISGWSSPMLAGNNFPAFSSWAVNLLLKWHRQDPVSDKEIARNDAVSSYQHNRNPFIDHPEMVEYIWGNMSNSTWSSSIGAEPEINRPAEGSAIDLGLTAAGIRTGRQFVVKTTNASGQVSLSVSGVGFAVEPATLTAAQTNAADGATATVSVTAPSLGTYSGTLTITSGKLTRTIPLTATAVDGLPAGPAREISDESFVAVWTYIGDADANGEYIVTVSDREGVLDEFPCAVRATDGQLLVENLQPATDYTYTVASRSLVSAPVKVRTADPIPSVEFLYDGDLAFSTMPGQPSEAAEVMLDIENIDTDITVSVDEPFQLSTDKVEWSTSIVLSPEEDRMYMRLFSMTEGTFVTSISARTATFFTDDATVEGRVTASATFFEDFEETGTGSYSPHQYQGTACLWNLDDTGIWSSDPAHSGNQALRGGRSTKARIEMAEDKSYGIGSVKFFARLFNNDPESKVAVKVSIDGGATWHTAGEVTVSSTTYTEYTVDVKAAGDARIMLEQTAGKRFLVDDLGLTDYYTGLDDPMAGRHQWDAHTDADGVLVVENAAAAPLACAVYGVDGITYFSGMIAPGTATFPTLPRNAMYIVVIGDFSRRVIVR